MICRSGPAWRPILFVLAVAWLLPCAQAGENPVEARMRSDLTFLASDECEGRGPLTHGIDLAAEYVANQFKKAGLKPAGGDGSYFQPFSISAGVKLEGPNTVVLRGPLGQEIELAQGRQFQVVGLSAAGRVTAPLAFAGYGISSPKAGYDDYAGIDAKGKLLVMLRRTPRFGNANAPFDRHEFPDPAALSTKVQNAEAHQAAGILFVNDEGTAGAEDRLMDFGYTAFDSLSHSKLPAVHVSRSVADSMLQASLGKGLAEVEKDIERQVKPQSADLNGWRARLDVHVNRLRAPVKNVIGVLEGSGPLAHETVVIGAHYDHLGYGGFGSLARNLKGKAIHHGADDNASGTTTLMELARRFNQPGRQGRRLVFIAFSGEERGLLGSAYYCRHPVFPLQNTVAMVNMDMVGRLRPDKESDKPKLIVYGTGTAKTFDALIDSVNAKYNFKLQKIKTGMGPSDQQSFYEKKIPVFFFFTGDHPDYHRPSDTSNKINFSGMARIANLVEDLVEHLELVEARPQYVAVSGGPKYAGMQGPALGVRPAYDDEKEGLLLNGVSPGGPAAKAGLREGDRIVELAGKHVRNIGDYMAILAGQKQGNIIDVVVLRDGKKVTLKVTL